MARKSETRSESMKKRCSDPEYRARMSEARRKQWENPEYRALMSQTFAERGRSRLGDDSPNYRHGCSRTPEFRAYFNAKQRCENPNNPYYPKYGGRGLEFGFSSFEEFFKEVGPRPSKDQSLDRIDNDLGYIKGNLRWTTGKVQVANRRKYTTIHSFTDAELRAEIQRRGLVLSCDDGIYADA